MSLTKKLFTLLVPLFLTGTAVAGEKEKTIEDLSDYKLGMCVEKLDSEPVMATYVSEVGQDKFSKILDNASNSYWTKSSKLKIDIIAWDEDILPESGIDKIMLYEDDKLYAGQQFNTKYTEEAVFSITIEHTEQGPHWYKAVAVDKSGRATIKAFYLRYNNDFYKDYRPDFELEVEGKQKWDMLDNKSDESVNFTAETGKAEITVIASDPGFEPENNGIKSIELYEGEKIIAYNEFFNSFGENSQRMDMVVSCSTSDVCEYTVKIKDTGGNFVRYTFTIKFYAEPDNFDDDEPHIGMHISNADSKMDREWPLSKLFVDSKDIGFAAVSDRTEGEIVLSADDYGHPYSGIKGMKFYENDKLIYSWEPKEYAPEHHSAKVKVGHDSGLYLYKLVVEDLGENVEKDEMMVVFGAKCK